MNKYEVSFAVKYRVNDQREEKWNYTTILIFKQIKTAKEIKDLFRIAGIDFVMRNKKNQWVLLPESYVNTFFSDDTLDQIEFLADFYIIIKKNNK